MYVTSQLTLNFQNNINNSLVQVLPYKKMLAVKPRYQNALTFLPRASGMEKKECTVALLRLRK